MKDSEEDFALNPELLLTAYASGIFPMAEGRDSQDLFWVDPERRGILPLHDFHISRSLARRIRHGDYLITLNRDFAGVVTGCADREDTWISHEIEGLYRDLHRMGYAHSLEIWEDKKLVGGVYGVTLGAAFFGESMFSRRRDASKLALAYLTHHLERCGFTLFDTQFLTPHLASLGAVEVPRSHYRKMLAEAVTKTVSVDTYSLASSITSVLQRKTQRS